jgi:hypothetical protein
MSELDFVLALHTRHRNLTACCGPLLCVQISPWRAHGLEQIFDSDTASELLWSGHHSAEEYGTSFTLCGAHWLDLTALALLRSRQHSQADWHAEADQLLREVCASAAWDPKEIVNMFQWQGTRLT